MARGNGGIIGKTNQTSFGKVHSYDQNFKLLFSYYYNQVLELLKLLSLLEVVVVDHDIGGGGGAGGL
jgi:glycerol-3-phosphate O-acyltransferase